MAKDSVKLVMDSRLKKFTEGRIWDGGVFSIRLSDVDETFFFIDQLKAQNFLNEQVTERFADKSLRKGYFDYVEENPAGNTTHRYYIEKLEKGKIVSFREEVV